MNILRRRAFGVGVGVGAIGAGCRYWMRRLDDFDVKPCTKRLEVGDVESPVRWDGSLFGEEGRKLSKAESSEDGGDVCVVREVEVEGLIGGECRIHTVQGDIILRGWGGDEMALEPVKDLFDIANAYGTSGRGLKVVVAGEGEVDAVLVGFPFLVGEKVTPRAVTIGYSLVGTESLGVVESGCIPFKVWRHGIEPCSRILEIDLLPDNTGVGTSCSHRQVRIIAVHIARQTVVEVRLFDDELQGSIGSPCKSKEASQEVLSTFCHTILSG